METPDSRVKLAQAVSAQLRQYLHTLPPEAWSRPSACHHWEVRDVVGHLILAAELYLGVISRGLQGDTSPPAGFPPAGTANAASWSALFDPMSVARRESLGDQLLATFTATSDQLHQSPCRMWPAGLGDPMLSSRQSAPRADDCRSAAHGVSDARVGHLLPV